MNNVYCLGSRLNITSLCISLTRITAFLGAAAMSLIVGCTNEYAIQETEYWGDKSQVASTHSVSRQGDWVLPADSPIYIAKPQTPQGSDSTQQAVTNQICANLAKAMSEYFPQTTLGADFLFLEDALAEARRSGNLYLIYPKLVQFHQGTLAGDQLEDEAEDIRAISRSRISVQLMIYDVLSRQFIEGVTVHSKGGWLADFKEEPSSLIAEGFALFSRQLSAVAPD